MAGNTKREQLDIIRTTLENDRSSFRSHWKQLGDYILPTRPRFTLSKNNRGDRRNTYIIDSVATMASRTLASGMMSGVTSPARPWFRLTVPDATLAEVENVKQWLHIVTQRMSTVFLRSNLYNVLPIIYRDMGVFGTACMFVEEDFDSVVFFKPIPIGTYWLSADRKGKVNIFHREFRMTIRTLIDTFGRRPGSTGDEGIEWSKFSNYVRSQWDSHNPDRWVDVYHTIRPNPNHRPGDVAGKYKRFESTYWESGGGVGRAQEGDEQKFLRESGYDQFPVLAPRWEVTGEDVYGTDCPGMTALGDIKSLQTMQKKKAMAIDKLVDPPMNAPPSMMHSEASILPGDINFVDVREGQQGFRPVYEINPRVQEILLDIQDHRARISRVFFEDLFLMLAQTDRRQITAREIEERHEEKLLALGPVLEQLNQDLLDPLIDLTFDMMIRQNLIPNPPEEIQGADLRVEYISIMAQAQKLIGLAGIERFAGFAAQSANVNPESLDKVNVDQLLDVYGDITSIPPGIVRSDEEVANIRFQRQQAAQAQQMAQMMNQGSQTAKNLSETNTEGDNALTRLIDEAQAGALTQV